MGNHDGDASFRLIPGDVAASELTITHDYYDHSAADRDVNCVFPIERLRELVESKEIGGVVTQNVSFMGHILGRERGRFVSDKIPEIVDIFRSCRADAVLTTPG
jgi:D-proline reductase (dithiol) PrdB